MNEARNPSSWSWINSCTQFLKTSHCRNTRFSPVEIIDAPRRLWSLLSAVNVKPIFAYICQWTGKKKKPDPGEISPWILSKTRPPSRSFKIHSLWSYKGLQCAPTQIRKQEGLSLWFLAAGGKSQHIFSPGQRKLSGCSQATAATFIALERDTVVRDPPESCFWEQLHPEHLLYLIFSWW